VNLEFYQPLPIFNTGTDNSIWAKSCRPPDARVERGSYFTGDRSQFIQLVQFQAHRTFTITMWAKVLAGDSTLFSFEGDFFNGWDN
jgi:hypothetical protein